jgi:hypothetical protein
MTPEELLHAAEAKLRDAENNLATCVASLKEHAGRHGGGVPNSEIVALAHAQAAVAQTYATLALAKAGLALAYDASGEEPTDA